ncbi:hypothetical protein EI94DRAFT_1709868 [Lactarius quietus]|nr:hypothetical protein EI94DRAFT_1709868 [Lactarius quietus]
MGNENVTVANGPNPTSRSTKYSAIHQSNSEVSDTHTRANDTPTMRSVTQTAPATQAIQGNAANRGSSVPTSYSTPRHPANIQDADPVSRMSGRGSARSTPGLTLFSEPESGGHTMEVLATAPMVKREALEQCMTLDFNRKKWPSNIELVFPDGSSTKLNLTNQNPLVHTIVQDVIENLFSKKNEDYLMKMTQLPRAQISLMQAEVKECCNAVTSDYQGYGKPWGIGQGYWRVGVRVQELLPLMYPYP